jgi:hypothetical protein
MKKLASLAGGTLLLWGLLIYPGWRLWGDAVWAQSLSALGLCLIPAMAALAWAQRNATPEMQLVAVLGGSGIRLACALGGGLLLHTTLPQTFTNIFWLWLALFYMFILALETILVVRTKNVR